MPIRAPGFPSERERAPADVNAHLTPRAPPPLTRFHWSTSLPRRPCLPRTLLVIFFTSSTFFLPPRPSPHHFRLSFFFFFCAVKNAPSLKYVVLSSAFLHPISNTQKKRRKEERKIELKTRFEEHVVPPPQDEKIILLTPNGARKPQEKK